jgi:hypothetical protein
MKKKNTSYSMLLKISHVSKKKRIGPKNGFLTIVVVLLQDLLLSLLLKASFFPLHLAAYIGSRSVD